MFLFEGRSSGRSNVSPSVIQATGEERWDIVTWTLIYKSIGNLRAVQILLGHTNIQNTVRYLGVDVDDAITLSERTEI